MPDNIAKLQMMVTVPKKKRRRAVDRVLLRRRIREAYRLNRISLREMLENNPRVGTLSVAFVYIHDQNMPYAVIQDKMKTALAKLEAKCREF